MHPSPAPTPVVAYNSNLVSGFPEVRDRVKWRVNRQCGLEGGQASDLLGFGKHNVYGRGYGWALNRCFFLSALVPWVETIRNGGSPVIPACSLG